MKNANKQLHFKQSMTELKSDLVNNIYVMTPRQTLVQNSYLHKLVTVILQIFTHII